MNGPADLARGWLRKAESDLADARRTLESEGPYDTACFHAQQAVEKCLKAALGYFGEPISRTHNLGDLAGQACLVAPGLELDAEKLSALTPFAVELRYAPDFWPDRETAPDALAAAEEVLRRRPVDPGIAASQEDIRRHAMAEAQGDRPRETARLRRSPRGDTLVRGARGGQEGIQDQAFSGLRREGGGEMKKRFAICIDNDGYPASLDVRKVYRVLPDPAAESSGRLRVIDESGEGYLYPRDRFVPMEIPKLAERVFDAGHRTGG